MIFETALLVKSSAIFIYNLICMLSLQDSYFSLPFCNENDNRLLHYFTTRHSLISLVSENSSLSLTRDITGVIFKLNNEKPRISIESLRYIKKIKI